MNDEDFKILDNAISLAIDQCPVEDIKIIANLPKKIKDEIERLNNIINELEKWIKENDLGKYRTENVVNTDELLDKLQELKGDSSNE